ncbi:VOC family protein [Kurthia massiliensis]|uniref:VOC family protein n=1 Tax=Kurthia massiliensis TaxID=1033739 RepID=UPI0002896D4F|nr:VOC family protein [Kurthia massiliensis]
MFDLDHVVYFTKKSPTEIAQEVSVEGIHPVEGGQHLQWGTHNALLYTKNSYIEYLSVEDETVTEQSKHPLMKQLLNDLQFREGFGSVCLRSDNLEEQNKYFQKLGYRTSGILDSERKTKSGAVRKWRMLFIDHKIDKKLPYPFFIQWDTSDNERYESLREDGTITPDNESLVITKCIFDVQDVNRKMTHWSRLLSLPIKGNQLKLGNTVFEFRESRDSVERLQSIEIAKEK